MQKYIHKFEIFIKELIKDVNQLYSCSIPNKEILIFELLILLHDRHSVP